MDGNDKDSIVQIPKFIKFSKGYYYIHGLDITKVERMLTLQL